MTFTIESLKKQARRLRADLEAAGTAVSHSQALELVAHQHGYRDWNTIHATAGNRPPRAPLAIGQHVRGEYLGQAFSAVVIGLEARLEPGRQRVTLQLDTPVDVVRFDSFSAWRSRVSGTVDSDGVTAERTSDGTPHLRLHLQEAHS